MLDFLSMISFKNVYIQNLIMLSIAILPFTITIFNVAQFIFILKSKSFNGKFIILTDFYTIIYGTALTVHLLILKDYFDYMDVLYSSDLPGTFITTLNLPAVISLFIVGIVGYTVVRIKGTHLPPLLLVLMFSFMFIGMGINIAFLTQLSKNITDINIVFVCLFPFNFIICSIILMKKTVLKFVSIDKIYDSKFSNYVSKMLLKSPNMIMGAFKTTFPILLCMMLILTLFGQSPDCVIKAFTKTMVLSEHIYSPIVITTLFMHCFA